MAPVLLSGLKADLRYHSNTLNQYYTQEKLLVSFKDGLEFAHAIGTAEKFMFYTPKYNIIVAGDRQVGKSCLIYGKLRNRFVDPLPSNHYTNRTDINDQIKISVDGKYAKVFNWEYPYWLIDSPVVYDKLKEIFLSDRDLIILCFDIGNRDSLASISEKWIQDILQFGTGTPIIVVGLKSDLRIQAKFHDQLVSFEEGKEMADIVGALAYLECSAKSGIGIHNVYAEAIRSIRKYPPHQINCTIQ
ncbi:hypothetical protein HDV06_002353 [Boothiomyces sp. JEL0866]|nr:hypothetical protein HDV06_002353 [Boothiomyces sp. JEL0866]